MGDAARFLNPAAGLVEQRLKLGRMGQDQPFQLIIVRDRQQHGNRSAVPGDDHRPFLALFQVGA